MSHSIRMLVGCLLPIFAIFLLPLFGIRGDGIVFVAIVLMFACHLLMMRDHRHGGDHARHEPHEGEDR